MLKTSSNQYRFTYTHTATHSKETSACGRLFKSKMESAFPSKPSLMDTLTGAFRPPSPFQKEGAQPHNFASKMGQSREDTSQTPPFSRGGAEKSDPQHLAQMAPNRTPIHMSKEHAGEARTHSKPQSQQTKTEQRQNGSTPLILREWKKEETKQWWEARYHEREREGGNKGHDQEHHQEKEEKKGRISKSAQASTQDLSSRPLQTEKGAGNVKKPALAPPKIGVLALYFILTKMGIFSDGVANFAYKKEVELIDAETTETHKKKLEEMKEAIKKEKESEHWGIASQLYSWLASLVSIISGIVLIATGVGVVAGALLIAGGLIQLTSQLLELTGGWQKIAALLPGEDSAKKAAVIRWMQIGIAVLCLVLAGAGTLWTGYSHVSEVLSKATQLMGAIGTMGQGVVAIGAGVSEYHHKDKMGDIMKQDRRLAQLKHMRDDLMDKVEGGVDRLEKLFEDLAQALEFDEELFQADQIFYRG